MRAILQLDAALQHAFGKLAMRFAETGRLLGARRVMTATPTMVMGAAAPARTRTAGLALRQPALNQHATQSAETARRLVRRDATMAPPWRATGARQLAQSSAASFALGAPRPLRTRANRPAATETRLWMKPATTATPSMVMGAAAPARWKRDTCALRQPALNQHATQSAETA